MGDLKKGWKRVKFAQLAECVNDRVDDPSKAGVERYVGLEHLDPESLTIRRWGVPTDVESTKLRFKPGDIIFGKRRAYQRKLAVADFEGICSAHAMVIRAKPEVVLPGFLPFLMQSDLFMERAVAISVGSLSPTINWKTLAAEEFALPPLEEQRRMVEVLEAADLLSNAWEVLVSSVDSTIDATLEEIFSRGTCYSGIPIEQLCTDITVGIVVNPSSFYDSNGVLAISHSNIERGFIDSRVAQRISVDGHRIHSKSWIRKGDVVLPRVSTLQGRPYYAAVVGEDLHDTNAIGILILRPRETINPNYLAAVLNSPTMRRRLIGASVGSIQRQLNVGVIRKLHVNMPPLAEQHRVSEMVASMFAGFNTAQRRYEILRKDLIQRLRTMLVESV